MSRKFFEKIRDNESRSIFFTRIRVRVSINGAEKQFVVDNAIANACGARVYHLPATPEKVKAALKQGK